MSKDPNYYEANRGTMVRFLPTTYTKVLEVGCGTGSFHQHLQQPCETWGIEPNEDAAAIAATRLHRVLVGRYDQQADSLPDHYFDIVVCNDVIEHMVDPDAFLEAVKQKLRPDGWVVGSIPNVRHITALFKLLVLRDWRYTESGILDRTHLRFFTRKSLLRTLREHRFSIERLEGIGSIITNGISRNINKPNWVQSLTYRAVSFAVVVVTLGYYWDTQYPQYGFRARLG